MIRVIFQNDAGHFFKRCGSFSAGIPFASAEAARPLFKASALFSKTERGGLGANSEKCLPPGEGGMPIIERARDKFL